MQLNPRDVLEVLRQKGVQRFYHANTVRSSLTFLQAGGLLSRGTVEDCGLDQTPQSTDDLDKRFGIWHDIFIDGVDIHSRSSNCNAYGPVLFELNLRLFESDALPALWITRDNPCRWEDGDSDQERYYLSVDEFQAEYNFGDF